MRLSELWFRNLNVRELSFYIQTRCTPSQTFLELNGKHEEIQFCEFVFQSRDHFLVWNFFRFVEKREKLDFMRLSNAVQEETFDFITFWGFRFDQQCSPAWPKLTSTIDFPFLELCEVETLSHRCNHIDHKSWSRQHKNHRKIFTLKKKTKLVFY